MDIDMGAVLREAAAIVGGKGGGRPDFAQGAGADVARVGEALEKASRHVREALA